MSYANEQIVFAMLFKNTLCVRVRNVENVEMTLVTVRVIKFYSASWKYLPFKFPENCWIGSLWEFKAYMFTDAA